MAVSRCRGAIGALIAGSMLFSSTGAIAAASSVPTYQPDPWAVLSAMSGGASAVAVCGAAAAAATAAQATNGCVLPQVDAPPPMAQNPPPQAIPVPPAEAVGVGSVVSPLLWAIAVLAAGAGFYLLLHNNGNGNGNSPT